MAQGPVRHYFSRAQALRGFAARVADLMGPSEVARAQGGAEGPDLGQGA